MIAAQVPRCGRARQTVGLCGGRDEQEELWSTSLRDLARKHEQMVQDMQRANDDAVSELRSELRCERDAAGGLRVEVADAKRDNEKLQRQLVDGSNQYKREVRFYVESALSARGLAEDIQGRMLDMQQAFLQEVERTASRKLTGPVPLDEVTKSRNLSGGIARCTARSAVSGL